MNKIILTGNLTRDPELNETPNGIAVCKFTIAVNRKYTDSNGEKGCDFFNVIAWRGLAETAAKYLEKGKKAAVVGSLEFRNYEDKSGIKRQIAEVIASEIEFLTPKNDDENTSNKPKNKPKMEEFEDDSDSPF